MSLSYFINLKNKESLVKKFCNLLTYAIIFQICKTGLIKIRNRQITYFPLHIALIRDYYLLLEKN